MLSIPSATRMSLAATCHCFAAASTKVARVTAAASRSGVHRSLTLEEPPVIITPTCRANDCMNQRTLRAVRPSSSGLSGTPAAMPATLPYTESMPEKRKPVFS